jgi:hypothetical protein
MCDDNVYSGWILVQWRMLDQLNGVCLIINDVCLISQMAYA